MRQEHIHIEIIFEGLARAALYPAEESDTREINRVSAQNRHQSEDDVEQNTQARTNRPYVLHAGSRRLGRAISAHIQNECSKENQNRQCDVHYFRTKRRLVKRGWGE